jgi:hypothetical protein
MAATLSLIFFHGQRRNVSLISSHITSLSYLFSIPISVQEEAHHGIRHQRNATRREAVRVEQVHAEQALSIELRTEQALEAPSRSALSKPSPSCSTPSMSAPSKPSSLSLPIGRLLPSAPTMGSFGALPLR